MVTVITGAAVAVIVGAVVAAWLAWRSRPTDLAGLSFWEWFRR